MADITDLTAERTRRASPDAEFMGKDDYGRPLFTFLMSYEMDGREYGSQIVAYSPEDAEARIAAMRATLKYDGKLFTRIPV